MWWLSSSKKSNTLTRLGIKKLISIDGTNSVDYIEDYNLCNKFLIKNWLSL